ncbi:hypothetical protein HAX54_017865, partial [Datura stramonium]|nr:hypothetical protein [Datura stramonium]
LIKFNVFGRETIFDCECFHLITGLNIFDGDFDCVSARPNRLLKCYFLDHERIKVVELMKLLEFSSSNYTFGFWDKPIDLVKFAELYIVERVLLGHDLLSGKTETLSQVELDLEIVATTDVDCIFLESEDVGYPGGKVCNKRLKIDERKKPDADAPFGTITSPVDIRLSVGTDIYCTAEYV